MTATIVRTTRRSRGRLPTRETSLNTAVVARSVSAVGKSPARPVVGGQALSKTAVDKRASSRKPEKVVKRTSSPLVDIPARLLQPVRYVPHPVFDTPRPQSQLLKLRPAVRSLVDAPTQQDAVAFLPSLVQFQLLTKEEEQYLFAWMNFVKFQAEELRLKAVAKNKLTTVQLERFDSLMAEAVVVRNQLVQCNLRLVVALAHKLSRSVDQLSELTSEGVQPLVRAVELFDISLGNKFSTYATWAVRNQMVRWLKKSQSNPEVSIAEQEDRLIDPVSEGDSGWEPDPLDTPAAVLTRLMTHLTDRERLVLSARYGLGGQPSGQSLSEISGLLGLSKERVRQVALQAVAKLRDAAGVSIELL